MDTTPEVHGFIARYEAATNGLEIDVPRRLMHVYLAATPGFEQVVDYPAALHAALETMRDFYRGIGRGELHAIDLHEQRLGAYYSLVTVRWTATFPKVEAPIPFEVSYLLQRLGEERRELRVIASMAHEDEEAMLREHGILPAA